jgi:hypothetical protein
MLARLPPARAPSRARASPLARRASTPRAVAAPPPAQRDADVLLYQRPRGLARVAARPGAPPLLILPGFGNDASDYTTGEGSCATALRSRGFDVHVLPVQRSDWFGVARGLLTPAFYRGTCTTDEGARAAPQTQPQVLSRAALTPDSRAHSPTCAAQGIAGTWTAWLTRWRARARRPAGAA